MLDRLQTEFAATGRAEAFQHLEPCLLGERGRETYAELAARLGTTEAALGTMVHRLRKRYRELFREEIAHTVASLQEVEEEMRHLVNSLCR